MTTLWQSETALISVLALSVIGVSAVLVGIRHASASPDFEQATPCPVWHEVLVGSLLQVPLVLYLVLVH